MHCLYRSSRVFMYPLLPGVMPRVTGSLYGSACAAWRGGGRLGGPVGYPVGSGMVDLCAHSCARDDTCSCHCHHPRGGQILLSLLLGAVEAGDLVVFPRPDPSHLDPHTLAYVVGGPFPTNHLRLQVGMELSLPASHSSCEWEC